MITPERLQEIQGSINHDRKRKELFDWNAEGMVDELFDYIDELIATIEASQAELAEGQAYYERVMSEECASDEIHCTCVPALRAEIDALRKQLAEAIEDNKWAIKYREAIFEDRAMARKLAEMQEWIDANPDRKRAFEHDTEEK